MTKRFVLPHPFSLVFLSIIFLSLLDYHIGYGRIYVSALLVSAPFILLQKMILQKYAGDYEAWLKGERKPVDTRKKIFMFYAPAGIILVLFSLQHVLQIPVVWGAVVLLVFLLP